MQFLVDENVAGLARWLRFLGYDTKLVTPGDADTEVSRIARKERRLLITRDGLLAQNLPHPQVILLTTDKIVDQLRAILDRVNTMGFQSEPSHWFTLCTRCNAPLRDLPKDLWTCPECGRLYWKGSHYARTKNFLETLMRL